MKHFIAIFSLILSTVAALPTVSRADSSYTADVGLRLHTYRIGDHVLADFDGKYYDATIDALTPDGMVHVQFADPIKTKKMETKYRDIDSIKPVQVVSKYKYEPLFSSIHTYHIGEHVLAPFGPDMKTATIEQLTEDGDVRVRFDNAATQSANDGLYGSVSDLKALNSDPKPYLEILADLKKLVKFAKSAIDEDSAANKGALEARSSAIEGTEGQGGLSVVQVK